MTEQTDPVLKRYASQPNIKTKTLETQVFRMPAEIREVTKKPIRVQVEEQHHDALNDLPFSELLEQHKQLKNSNLPSH